jgi:hypothetical protein
LTRAIAIAPNVAEALARLAVMDARMGRWEEGVTLSLKAMRLGARGSELMSAHIRSLAHVGRCGDAALLSSLHASGLDASAAAKVRAEWTELAKVCATAVAPRPDNGADQPSP